MIKRLSEITQEHSQLVRSAVGNLGLDFLIEENQTTSDLVHSALMGLADGVGEIEAEEYLLGEINWWISND